MTTLRFIDKMAAPVATSLLLAGLPMAFIGFFIQGF